MFLMSDGGPGRFLYVYQLLNQGVFESYVAILVIWGRRASSDASFRCFMGRFIAFNGLRLRLNVIFGRRGIRVPVGRYVHDRRHYISIFDGT